MTENTMTRRDMIKVSVITALGLGGALTVGPGALANTEGTFTAWEGSPTRRGAGCRAMAARRP